MKNVSFKANLIVDPSIYREKPTQASVYDPERLIEGYKGFLEQPVIKNLTQGDTVKLSRCAYTERDGMFKEGEKRRKKLGWGIIMEFVSDKLQKPFVWELGFGENSTSSPHLRNFAIATIDFLAVKAGVQTSEERKDFGRKILAQLK